MNEDTQRLIKVADYNIQQRIIKEGYLRVSFVFVLVLFIGIAIALVDHSRGTINSERLLLYIIPSLLYGFSIVLSKRDHIPSFGYLLLASIYITHTILELSMGISPRTFVDNMSFSSTEILNRGTIIMDLFPVIYMVFRLAISMIFIRLFIAKIKIRKYQALYFDRI